MDKEATQTTEEKGMIRFYIPVSEMPKLSMLIRLAERMGYIDTKGKEGYTAFFNWLLRIGNEYLKRDYLNKKGIK